jgi:adenosylmethionine-8-amino-7-oxononanoate aminotransferase
MTSAAAGTSGLTPEQISAIDAAHLWHPYSTIGAEAVPPVVAVGAHGAWLTLIRDGKPVEVLDAMSSWWTAIHGHGHPVLDAALTAQLATMNHVMFGGLTHEPAARLAQLLVDITPSGLDTVFFCDSGSVSVEVAVKMALQYWRSRGRPGKRRLMTWRGGYHGDTFTPMSICDPDGGMHELWAVVRGTAGRPRRRTGRCRRRAGGTGCRRDALPRSALPDRPAGDLPTP